MQIIREREFSLRRWSDIADLDWYVLAPVIILISFSLLLLKSAAEGMFFSKQLMYILPACLIGIGALYTRIKVIQDSAIWIYIINIFLLIFVLIKGTTVMGSQRWISLGPINIQPSELAKLALIVTLASWFSKHPIKNYKDIFFSALLVAPPFFLIFKQPDLGTSLAFGVIYLGMCFWAGATATHLLVVCSPLISLLTNATGKILLNFGTLQIEGKILELTLTTNFIIFLSFFILWLVINYRPWQSPWIVLSISLLVSFNFLVGFIRPILWNFLHPYQQKRLTIFLNPESDPLGAGYHIVQSLLAIGNGGFLGYGLSNGRLTKGNFVPAQHTDFIFSTVGEELGFIGAAFIVLTFAFLLWRILYIAANSNDDFSSLLAVGVFSFFLFHIFINIGMTIGLMPITGVPLPLLSYGGSALVVDLLAIFVLVSISWRTLPRKIF